jgi:hypothetical protein
MCYTSFFQQVIPNVGVRLDLAGSLLFRFFTCLQPASCPRQRYISLIIQLGFCQHFFIYLSPFLRCATFSVSQFAHGGEN